MFKVTGQAPPPGRIAARWLIFLTLFHLLPIPWFLLVAAGLAPASFLTLTSLASLFNRDFDSLAFALLFFVPAIIGSLLVPCLPG